MHDLRSDVWLPARVEDVWAFFTDPRNLGDITPREVGLRLVGHVPTEVEEGVLLVHRMKAKLLPVLWVSRFEEVAEPRRFVDRQVWGPFLHWRHEHFFVPEDDGTRVRDHVEYSHVGGPLVERRFVRPMLERVFAYRRDALRRAFRGHRGHESMEPSGALVGVP